MQQTRVRQGLDYYHRFLEKFPDVHSLAAAPESEVLKAWQGLGYYSRARHMHQAAKTVVNRHKGLFPADFNELLSLPGVGEYIAGALASFAFNLPCPVMDGNVLRFISRLKGILEPVNSARGRSLVREILQDEIDRNNPALFNQAAMEFGALVCTPQKPDCTACPLRNVCVARNTGHVDKIPVKDKKALPRPRYFHYLVFLFERNKQLYTVINQRTGDDIWKNMYEFPLFESDRLLDWEELVATDFCKNLLDKKICAPIGHSHDFRHILSHRILHARSFLIRCQSPPDGFLEVSANELKRFPVPKLVEKVMDHHHITFDDLK